jgi:ankyrin repeat protein
VCQTEDWASHKLVCKNVGAARKQELVPLLLAAQDGDVATVKKLLNAGAKVDGGAITDNQRRLRVTPLFTAANSGHAAVIAFLLKASAKINRTTTGGFTPLFVAARMEHRAAVSVRIEAGADIDFGDDN